jgi:hypothetical protein
MKSITVPTKCVLSAPPEGVVTTFRSIPMG